MVVQKFGGTSVADPDAIRRLIEIVRAARARDGRGPVVVVSAMSGVTDALLAIAAEAGAGADRTRARARSSSCASGISPGARALARRASRRARGAHQRAVRSARRRRQALAVLREVSPRTLDVVAAMGELLSSRIVAAALVARRPARRMGGRPARHRHQRRSHARDAARRARRTRRCARRSCRCSTPAACRCSAASSAPRVDGTHDDARPRRVGLFRRARRRRHRRARDSDLDRRGRHAHRRSARHRRSRGSCRSCRLPRPRSWPTSARRCCIRARSCRPSSATSRCAFSTRASPTARARSSPPTPSPDGDAADRRWPPSAT